MKKVSTAAVTATKNFSQPKLRSKPLLKVNEHN
jgi:hypothetical protein